MFSPTARLAIIRSNLALVNNPLLQQKSSLFRRNGLLGFKSNTETIFSLVFGNQVISRRLCASNNQNDNKNNKITNETEKKETLTDATEPKKQQQEEPVVPIVPTNNNNNKVEAGETKIEETEKPTVEAENNNDDATTPVHSLGSDFFKQMQARKLAGSSKNDEISQVENDAANKLPPKGFELFFLPPFKRPPPAEDYKTPTVLSGEETTQINSSDRAINEAKLSRKLIQFLALIMVIYIFNKFRNRNSGAHHLGGEAMYYYDRHDAARKAAKISKEQQEKSATSTDATSTSNKEGSSSEAKDNATQPETPPLPHQSEADLAATDFDTNAIKYVTADPEAHTAVYYSEDGKRLFTQRFIDFGTWLRDIEQRATESGPFVRLDVHIGFPIVAVAFLWLMPVLGRFYRSVNFGLGHARKEAQNALKKAQNVSELETPSKGRFRFKKETELKTRLDDVAGLTEAKHEVTEIIDFLKAPEKYSHLGAKLPKGVLIDGPPGVGKTLLARAVAGEAGLNFVSCSGSEFDEVYVGVGAMRVRELFKSARENAPCVVFIDEIDTFGKKRRRDAKGSSRGTINALLSELDGFKESSRIMVLAATNRADILDDALTRSGRFDRKISVDLPPHKDRVAIALVHLKKLKLSPSLGFERAAEAIASLTPGCSGADLYNICNEAAIVASRLDKEFVDMECFHKSMDRIMIGLERKARKYEKHEKERLAIHEAGHVVLTWFLKTTDPIMKATIAPRGGATEGISRKLPHEKFIITQEALHERMIARLGGYVAEEFFFTNISANAAEDLAKVTNEAKGEICTYGMAPLTVGHFGFPTGEEDVLTKPYSGAKADIVDKEITGLVTSVSDTARGMLKKYQQEVRQVAGILLKQETVTAKELWVLLGERPQMSPEFRKYLESESY